MVILIIITTGKSNHGAGCWSVPGCSAPANLAGEKSTPPTHKYKKKRINSIPPTLQLAANQLSAGAIYQYNLQHLSYLSSLDLSSNLLSDSLSPPSFDLFPPNLRTLDLSLNSISRLASNTFSPLSRLTRLSLEGNAVEKVEDGAFTGLLSLTSLDLSHNSIVTLATDSLAGLPSLTHLNLAHNHLQVLS